MSFRQRDMKDKMKDPTCRVYLPEVLEELNRLVGSKDKTDQQNALFLAEAYIKKNNEHKMLMRRWIESVYHPAVVLDLPQELPPYDNSQYKDYDFAPTSLNAALAKVIYFVKGQPSYIPNSIRRETMFIQTLEGMYAKDAKLVEAILLKKFPKDVYKNLGIEFFYKVYPSFFKGIPVDEISKEEKATPKKRRSSTTRTKTSTSKSSEGKVETVTEDSKDG